MAATIDAAAIARQATAIGTAPANARRFMAGSLRERIIALEEQLDRQYDWLGQNPNHPDAPQHTDTWIASLHHYQTACDALAAVTTATQERLIA